MNKSRLISFAAISIMLLCTCLFPIYAEDPITFSQLKMDKEKTMSKYKDDWNDTTVKYALTTETYTSGSQVATITIPRMDIYEFPVYYGSNPVNNDWHITTPGPLGNWSMFGESGVSCVGAHNYQLFKNLPSLEKGDKILIETSNDRYVYVVESTAVYNHNIDNWNKTATHHTNDYALNLMTCYPMDAVKTDDMYIVYTNLQKGTVFNN